MTRYFKHAYQVANRGFSGVFRWTLQSLRILVVFSVLFYVAVMVWLVFFAGKVNVQAHSVLVLSLQGPLVEESAGGLRDQVMGQLQGESRESVRLRDLVQVLDLAANDKRIECVLLKLDDFKGGGLVSLREAAAALDRFKVSGKPVVAWSAAYDQRQYYLAAHASEVQMHPFGEVLIEGLGNQRNYYKEALDKLGIEANLIRVGQYKSAGEPFVLNAPSRSALVAEAYVLDALWALYTAGIEGARKLPVGSVAKNIDALPGALQRSQGNAGQLAKDWRWVDRLQTYEALSEVLKKEVGQDDDHKSFRQIGFKDYLRSQSQPVKGDHIAVIVAQGEISDGRAPAGQVGGVSTADLVRQATQDEEVKAIVLRVNSPGGSVLGSELVRDQLRLAREQGKPVVVSMGDVAASGGYWISLASDAVVADPATITGSIGVFAILPTGKGLMGKVGIHTGGYRTTWLAGAYDPRLALDPRVQALVQANVSHVYSEFVAKAARARQLPTAEVQALAQGRIWTGAQAQQRHLVDQLGNFNDAVDVARQLLTQRKPSARAARAPLPIRYLAAPVSALETLAQRWLGQFGGALGETRLQAWVVAAVSALGGGADTNPGAQALAEGAVTAASLRSFGKDFLWLHGVLVQGQPFGAVAHCLCQMAP